MSDGAERLGAVAELLESMYPGARAVAGPSAATPRSPGAAHVRQFRVLPIRTRPRLLVPADLPRATTPALLRVSALDGRREVAARRAVATLAASPLGRLRSTTIEVGPVDDESVEAYLAEVVGSPVRLSVQVGAVRANAKPVLGVYRVRGELEAGFAKVGSSDLAGRLVARESAVLQQLTAHGLTTLEIPPVLHAGRWRDREVLFLGAVRGSRGAGRGVPYEAMREIAGVAGVSDVPLAAGPWVASVRARLEDAGDTQRGWLREALDALVRRDGRLVVPHGSWHGDWGPWNMAWSGSTPVVWDWERCADGVPVGLDAAHFVAHAALRRIDDLDVAAAALADLAEPAVAQVLGPWTVEPARARVARAVVDAYVLEVACRFAADAAEVGTAPVERLASWYLEVAASRLGLRRGPDALGDVAQRQTDDRVELR